MHRLHQVRFDSLYTITNMPIARYLDWLRESGELEHYMSSLVGSFNPQAARTVMCRTMLSVSWDGHLHDCDFNQMLGMPLVDGTVHVREFDRAALEARTIQTGPHCFGCTAGTGSSCTGALAGDR